MTKYIKILISLCLIVVISCNIVVPIFALEINSEENISPTSIIEPTDYGPQIKECIIQMEGGITEENTDVVSELNNIIAEYTDVMNNDPTINQTQVLELIDKANYLIEAYSEYLAYSETNNSYTYSTLSDMDEEKILLEGSMALAVALFYTFRMDLATELLIHSMCNEELDSVYYPINSDDIIESSVFAEISSNDILESDDYLFSWTEISDGFFEDPLPATINDANLFLAIKRFKYTKSASGRTLVIHDRYDFAEQNEIDSAFDYALQVAFLAQKANVITPFNSVFIFDFGGTPINAREEAIISSSTYYYEDVATLGKSEYKDYDIIFEDSGKKTIQTFGSFDAYLSIFDSNGNLLISNDDSGYGLNSLIQYNFEENVEYTIRVKFYSSNQSGTVKLGIIAGDGEPQSGIEAIAKYEDIYSITLNENTISINDTDNKINMYTFTPAVMSNYTLTTSFDSDSYIGLIDPRQSYYIHSSEQQYNEAYINNSTINKDLCNDVPYLIIAYVDSTPHTHNYTEWVSISDTRHIECCECGVTGTTTGAHVTKASSTVNGKSYCIYCGYLVTLTDGFIPIIQNVQKVSVNGSYILPNGIIVLVDEDVEAYINGTLVFYDKDKLPEVQ